MMVIRKSKNNKLLLCNCLVYKTQNHLSLPSWYRYVLIKLGKGLEIYHQISYKANEKLTITPNLDFPREPCMLNPGW